MSRPSRARGILTAALSALLIAGTLLTTPVAHAVEHPAPATSTQVEQATLDWGVRASFRNYLLGPIAHGTYELLGTTSADADMQNAAGRFHWAQGSGEAQTNGSAANISFGAGNGVYFTGHRMTVDDVTGDALDMRFTNPRVEITSPTQGMLYLDVKSREFKSTTEISQDFFEQQNVPFATLDLSAGSFELNETTFTWSAVPANLTAQGSLAFGGFYGEGDPLDPVTFSYTTEEAVDPDPVASATSTTLTASTPSITQGETLSLTANVEPAEAEGELQFLSDGEPLASPKPLEQGSATFETRNLDVGEHTLTAEFVPADPEQFRASISDGVTVTVAEPAGSGVVGSMQWGIKESFRNYVVGRIANGEFTMSGGATQVKGNGAFTYQQAKRGSDWDGHTGTVQYAGNVNIYGHHGSMNVDIANPTINVLSPSKAEIRIPFGVKQTELTLATIDLSTGKRIELEGDAVRFSGSEVRLSKDGAEKVFINDSGEGPAGTFWDAGQVMDNITFTIGDPSTYDVVDPPNTDEKPKPTPKEEPKASGTGGAAAGSLKWGISSYFAVYTTQKSNTSGCPTPGGHCAGGSISTSGVGSGYLFPLAAGSDWDESAQTGTVKYSGVVAFKGYGLTMFQVANPSITVHSDSSATLHTGNTTAYGKGSYALNLSRASKSVGSNGEVTWSNVPVSGTLMGISAHQSIGLDNLTFTVGEASGVNFGSTEDRAEKKEYTAAATPPTTEGLEVLTPAEKITPGARIEIQARGFDPGDEGVLVVLYSDPVVLDDTAKADDAGVVRWSGTLPNDVELGDHVLTLQGSADAGAVIEVVEEQDPANAGGDGLALQQANSAGIGEIFGPGGMSLWEWWVSAGGLAAIAACTSVIAARQRGQLQTNGIRIQEDHS